MRPPPTQALSSRTSMARMGPSAAPSRALKPLQDSACHRLTVLQAQQAHAAVAEGDPENQHRSLMLMPCCNSCMEHTWNKQPHRYSRLADEQQLPLLQAPVSGMALSKSLTEAQM